MNLGLGPDERLGVDIIGGDESADVGHQFFARIERGACECLGREDREPDFDLVEPGRLCRGEVKMHVRCRFSQRSFLGL